MPSTTTEQRWQRGIYGLSALICLAVGFLILGPRPEGLAGTVDVSGLPAVNASLNGLAGVLLVIGYGLIRQRRVAQHRVVMVAAFVTSALFLVTYVVYNWFSAGPKIYEGDFRGLYLVILASHVLLSVVILPLALTTLYRGWNGMVERHRTLARVTLPLWLYVSVSGVLIYVMLYL